MEKRSSFKGLEKDVNKGGMTGHAKSLLHLIRQRNPLMYEMSHYFVSIDASVHDIAPFSVFNKGRFKQDNTIRKTEVSFFIFTIIGTQ